MKAVVESDIDTDTLVFIIRSFDKDGLIQVKGFSCIIEWKNTESNTICSSKYENLTVDI